jgi:glycosidase
VFSAFGPEPEMQLYERGIRRRLAPMLEGDRRRIELAYSLMLTLPGTPVIRYGDEIGKEVPEIGWGDFTVIRTRSPEILVLRYDWRNNSVLTMHNLSSIPREIGLAAASIGENSDRLVNLLSNDHSSVDKSGEHRILFEPYGYRWYRVGGLDYLLKRTEF